MNKFIWLSVFLMGCASTYIDSSAKKYLKRYKIYKKDFTGNSKLNYPIHVVVEPVTQDKIGMCLIKKNSDKTDRIIVLDEEWWNGAIDANKEVLFLHEMGHCDLDIKEHHSWGIMRPQHLEGAIYLFQQKLYLKKLFNKNFNPKRYKYE